MELADQKALQIAPQPARAQITPVNCCEHNVGAIARAPNLARPSERDDSPLDSQMLFDDFELYKARRLNHRDAFYQVSTFIDALDQCPDAALVTFGCDGVRQQHAKKKWRTAGNFLVEHESRPNRFLSGVEVKSRCERFAHGIAREQITYRFLAGCHSAVPRRKV